jgi:hypothetical protein
MSTFHRRRLYSIQVVRSLLHNLLGSWNWHGLGWGGNGSLLFDSIPEQLCSFSKSFQLGLGILTPRLCFTKTAVPSVWIDRFWWNKDHFSFKKISYHIHYETVTDEGQKYSIVCIVLYSLNQSCWHAPFAIVWVVISHPANEFVVGMLQLGWLFATSVSDYFIKFSKIHYWSLKI